MTFGFARAAEHMRQAEHNERLYQHLNEASPTYVDWQITALFYSALHYVDAYLDAVSPGGAHPRSHREREWHLQAEAGLVGIRPDYRELRDRSEEARYKLVVFRSELPLRLWAEEFGRIRRVVREALGLPSDE